MKTKRIKRLPFLMIGLAAILFLSAAPKLYGKAAAKSEPRIMRVAFPQVKGISETAEDGTHSGLVVDYLNEIAKYTNWQYEYIETTGETMLEEFAEGKFDLMGGQYYSDGLEEYFAYPIYNMGYSRAMLLARDDDMRIVGANLESLNGKVIGVYDRSVENSRRLKEFLAINNLDCEIKSYSREDLSPEGNFNSYLKNGDVDLLLASSLPENENLRIAASFESQPYYIVTNVGDKETLDGLNMAMEKILDCNPDFAIQRYTANFPNSRSVSIRLNEEETEYIQNKKTVTVAVPKDWHPMVCSTKHNHEGVTVDFLDYVTEFSKLKFSYVYTDSYEEAIQMVQKGEADMLGFFQGTDGEAAECDLKLSTAYAGLSNVVIRNKASSYPAKGLTRAVVDGQQVEDGIVAAQIKKYKTMAEALSAVQRGEADFVCGISTRVEHEMQNGYYSNLVPATLADGRRNFCFGLSRSADVTLLTILNKAVNNLPTEDKSKIIESNMVSVGERQISLMTIIYSEPVTFIAICAIILFIIVATILLIVHTHMKAAIIQSDLEKSQMENKAKSEFLSRMSHEIRTPINAVVGLTDLVAMQENVPEDIQNNLTKIRSSAHYLLSLINDILDISRIENGMLSIVKEPFDMEEMCSELQSMMSAEAVKCKLDFTLEKTILHSELAGDAIRLRQVLTNLLSNAFKFTPAGGNVRLQITETKSSGDNAEFLFQVIDNGIGIPAEKQSRIFYSFEQLGSNYAKSQGTGLGLPISKSIVERMGGELFLKSEVNQGSEFYFTVTLPLAKVQEQKEGLKAENLLQGRRILLAEDNDLNAEIVVQLLEIQGAEVCRVQNGKQVVEEFSHSERGRFQAILMDIQMPEMNGLEATRAIRALPRPDAEEIPIVAMTANSFQKDIDAAMDAGMNGFIPKPMDVKKLYALLQDMVQQENAEP